LGVDVPSIWAVIHVGVVRRLRDYAQESGRAGRDGRTSEAIIVRAVRYDRRGRPIEEIAEQAASGTGVEQAMWEFIETKGCVRAVLDREMDGRKDRVGYEVEAGEQACYRCEERARAAITGITAMMTTTTMTTTTTMVGPIVRGRVRGSQDQGQHPSQYQSQHPSQCQSQSPSQYPSQGPSCYEQNPCQGNT